MSNKKSTLRALVFSGLAMLISISMLAGTTFAWFTDSVSSGTNRIIAGNLDVEMNYYDDEKKDWADVQNATTIFNENARWEPGYTEVIYLQVRNVGNLAIKYRLALNILGQVIGQTKEGADIKLSDYINFGIVPGAKNGAYATREEAIAAVTEVHTLSEVAEGDNHAYARRNGEIVAEGEDNYFALVVWMPTSVGNEANHDGTHIPSIDLDITLVATQYTDEEDGFDDQYDKDATFPKIATGTATVNMSEAGYEIHLRNVTTGGKVASVVIPATAVDGNASDLKVNFEETALNPNITVEDGYEGRTYEVSVDGLADNNTEPVKLAIRLAPGLDPGTVKVYHYEEDIHCVYDPESGYATVVVTSFSPFTVVYDPNSVYVPADTPAGLPEANVTECPEYVNTDLPWGSYGQWSPTEGLSSKLEAAYKFECLESPEEAELNDYAEWYCDFVVVLDQPLEANQIFLGGNYGSFGWVGFHNGDLTLEANTEIPLLGSVTTNPWTYAQVAQNVGTFICGVGDVDDALAGATFTVMLRLTNPKDESEFYNVATITHKFATTVYSAEELQDAFNNGSTDIVLGGDIDLGGN